MRALLRFFSLRHLRMHLPRVLLALAAVALGVALFVSSNVTITSVRASMEETARSLAGEAQWRVTRGRSLGVELALLDRIRTLPGVIATPIIQSSAPLIEPRDGTLLILGVNFWDDALPRLHPFQGQADLSAFATTAFVPDGILITGEFARRHGLQIGSQLLLNTPQGVQELHVTGLLADSGPARALGGNFAIMELNAAQRLFGRPGFVDRIEVAHATREQLQQLCPGYEIAPAASGASMLEDALARIDSLQAVSLIALLVGLLIIYNSVQISVQERLKEIGTLRALGATRRQIFGILLIEWLLVGLVGSLLGVGFGYALSKGLLAYTSRTLNAMIPLIDIRDVKLAPRLLLFGMVLGTGTTGMATAIPAWNVIHMPPLDLLRPYGLRSFSRHGQGFKVGAICFLLGAGLVGLTRVSPAAGLAATSLVFLGVAMMLPGILLQFAYRVRPLLQRLFRLEGFLAADNMIKFPQRTALTAVTLGGALAMMVATATVVAGFRAATSAWITQALPFDFAVMATDFSNSVYNEETVPGTLETALRRTPGVELAYGVRLAFAEYRDSDIMVLGIETRNFLETHRRRGMSGWAAQLADPKILDPLTSGAGIAVSENFAALFGVAPGSKIELRTPSGPRSFQVLRTLEDYSWPHGVVLMDLNVLRALWKDDRLTYVDVRIQPGIDRETMRMRLASALTGHFSLFVYDKEQIRRISDDILVQTVAVADIQVIIAIVIGFLGIVNSQLISVLQRTREIGLIRAVGMTRRQVARTVVIEGVLIALVSGVIGVIGGLVGGWLPLRLFTFAITGYQYPLVVPWRHVLLCLAVAICVGFLASLLPARRAARLQILDAISYE
ncbi:MAG TPA: FtsX-like permease family protein [Chthonomonadaceae bacterium]|nr:FtsX-like permease family protein [Chthonomonadaceae bacterium]